MDFIQKLRTSAQQALFQLYSIEDAEINFEETNANFVGDLTFVVFPYLRFSKKKPEDTASEIGQFISENVSEVAGFNVVKGFLNVELSDAYFLSALSRIKDNSEYGPFRFQ